MCVKSALKHWIGLVCSTWHSLCLSLAVPTQEKLHVSECTTDHKHGPQNNWALNTRQSWLCRRNMLLLHTFTQCPGTSLHMISITRPSPMLVLQATNAAVRRPGYEATVYPLYHSFLVSYNSPKVCFFIPLLITVPSCSLSSCTAGNIACAWA